MIEDIERYCSDECPVQCERSLDEVEARLRYDVKSGIAQSVLMGENGKIVDEIIQRIADGQQEDNVDAAELKATIRSDAAEDLENIANEVEHQQSTRRQLAASCSGPLVISGSKNASL